MKTITEVKKEIATLEKERNKGEIGELMIRSSLAAFCASSKAHLLNNITIGFRDGTTQIDHILITKKGILVIETKHYSGWIFGEERKKIWTQCLYKKKYTFQNPLRQNYCHIAAVRKQLGFTPENKIQGIVVFTKDAEFKTEQPRGVILFKDLFNYLMKINLGVISDAEMYMAIGYLEYRRFQLTEETDLDHQKHIAQKFMS
ncbi:MAG: nuclease-related domain-containing protein [Candidatus Electrothrix aestuarii]|uniref:Nuclease-related domain-containing protein n=1 Tax=Candidatus Electrothrix aestuarii TaxID=3062594 RepID=A0AAU8LRZ5_9BACT|nr:nuclease-related domain-containing protein [Candidatus Electrothrix aestuarii]